MGRVWTDENKLAKWLEVELAATDALAECGQVPKKAAQKLRAAAKPPSPERVAEIEREVRHDLIAFTLAVAEQAGPEARYLHYGLTSSDVLDTATALAVQAGQLELNVMMPAITWNVLHSCEILKNTTRKFTDACVEGITANKDRCQRNAEATVALATALNPYIGYAKAAELAKLAVKSGRTITELALEKKLLDARQLKKILDPRRMTEPAPPIEEARATRAEKPAAPPAGKKEKLKAPVKTRAAAKPKSRTKPKTKGKGRAKPKIKPTRARRTKAAATKKSRSKPKPKRKAKHRR